MNNEDIERVERAVALAEKLAELQRKEKSVVDKASDLVVDTVKAPFKIAGRLFDDIFGL